MCIRDRHGVLCRGLDVKQGTHEVVAAPHELEQCAGCLLYTSTLVGLFNFTEYPAGASLDALGGKYKTADGKPVWLADVELEPYQALLVRR